VLDAFSEAPVLAAYSHCLERSSRPSENLSVFDIAMEVRFLSSPMLLKMQKILLN